MVDNFASLFNCKTVGRSLDEMLAPSLIRFRRSVLDYQYMWSDSSWSFCGILVSWLQIAIENFALLYQSIFDFMCLTVMFHRWSR